MNPIVRNVQNNGIYEYLGDNKFKNIVSEQEGIVSDEKAKEVFKINVEASEMCNEYPLLKDFMKSLNLKFDNNKK